MGVDQLANVAAPKQRAQDVEGVDLSFKRLTFYIQISQNSTKKRKKTIIFIMLWTLLEIAAALDLSRNPLRIIPKVRDDLRNENS